MCPNYKKLILWFCVIIALMLLTYSNHFNNTFHFDDVPVITLNPFIQSLKNIPLFFTDATTMTVLPLNQLYRPLLTTSMAFDYWIGNGLNPFWFHVSNFCWFILQCILMYSFLFKITNIAISSRWNAYFSLFCVAWYSLHTANAETINYITARSDSISTCWLILTFLVFINLPTYRKWGIYLIPFIIAFLFKEVVIVFPVLLFLYVLYFEEHCGLDVLFKKNQFPKVMHAFKTTIPSWIITVIMLALFIYMLSPSMTPGGPSVYLYMITEPFVIVHYVQSFFWPLSLSADSDWGLLSGINDWRFGVGVLFLMTMLTIAFFTSKKAITRPISFGILWFFIALLPTSSIIPLAEVLNDHRTFFPYIGLLLAVSYTLYLLIQRHIELFHKSLFLKVALAGSICLLLGAHAYGTYQRNLVWKTEESLWDDVTIKSPKNARAWVYFGVSQLNKKDYPRAETCFKTGLSYAPDYGILYTAMGILRGTQGKQDEAIAYFKQGIQHRPTELGPYYHYATYLKEIGEWKQAEEVLIHFIQLFPSDVFARHLLMRLYFENHQLPELIQEAKDTLKLNTHDKDALNYLTTVNDINP